MKKWHKTLKKDTITEERINQSVRRKLNRVGLLTALLLFQEESDLLAKAQEYIGLDMKTLNENKKRFLQEIEPKWIEEARKKGKLIEI